MGQKVVAWIWIFLTVLGISTQPAVASVKQASTQAEARKAQVENLPPGTWVKVQLKGHRQIEGQLTARSEEGFGLALQEPVAVRYADLERVTVDSDAQISPSGTPNTPIHHNHFLRNALIGFALGAVLYIVLAAVAKK